MPSSTKGYPYPADADDVDVPGDMQILADFIDLSPGVTSLSQSTIDGLSGAQKWAGRIVWNTTTSKVQRCNGSTWTDLTIASDLGSYATTTNLSDHASDTTAIHGIADTSALATATNLSDHASDTTAIHGIADTSQLATLSDVYPRDEAGHLIATSVFT
jgi:hypothetical protein